MPTNNQEDHPLPRNWTSEILRSSAADLSHSFATEGTINRDRSTRDAGGDFVFQGWTVSMDNPPERCITSLNTVARIADSAINEHGLGEQISAYVRQDLPAMRYRALLLNQSQRIVAHLDFDIDSVTEEGIVSSVRDALASAANQLAEDWDNG